MMVQGTCEPLSTRGSTLSSCCVGTCQMWTCEQSLPQQCLPIPWASSSVSPFNPHQLLSCFASWCVCVFSWSLFDLYICLETHSVVWSPPKTPHTLL